LHRDRTRVPRQPLKLLRLLSETSNRTDVVERFSGHLEYCDIPSSEVILLASTALVYMRVPMNSPDTHKPTTPTHMFAATPDLCGFERSRRYPEGAGKMGRLKSIVGGEVVVVDPAVCRMVASCLTYRGKHV
jgi:hypothetical protein